jgi:hypothetical protein
MNWGNKVKTASIILVCFSVGVFSKFCFLYCSHRGNAVHGIQGQPFSQSSFEHLVRDVEVHFDGVYCVGFPSSGAVYILDENGRLGFPRLKVMKFVRREWPKGQGSVGAGVSPIILPSKLAG